MPDKNIPKDVTAKILLGNRLDVSPPGTALENPELKAEDYHLFVNDTVILRKAIHLRREGFISRLKEKAGKASNTLTQSQITGKIRHELADTITKYKQRIVALQHAQKFLIYFTPVQKSLLRELAVEAIKLNTNGLLEFEPDYFDSLILESFPSNEDIEHKRAVAIAENKKVTEGKAKRKINIANLLSRFDDKSNAKQFEQEIYLKQQLVQVAILDALIGPHGEKYDDFVASIQDLASDSKQLIQLIKSLAPKSANIDVKSAGQLDNSTGPMLVSVQVNNSSPGMKSETKTEITTQEVVKEKEVQGHVVNPLLAD